MGLSSIVNKVDNWFFEKVTTMRPKTSKNFWKRFAYNKVTQYLPSASFSVPVIAYGSWWVAPLALFYVAPMGRTKTHRLTSLIGGSMLGLTGLGYTAVGLYTGDVESTAAGNQMMGIGGGFALHGVRSYTQLYPPLPDEVLPTLKENPTFRKEVRDRMGSIYKNILAKNENKE